MSEFFFSRYEWGHGGGGAFPDFPFSSRRLFTLSGSVFLCRLFVVWRAAMELALFGPIICDRWASSTKDVSDIVGVFIIFFGFTYVGHGIVRRVELSKVVFRRVRETIPGVYTPGITLQRTYESSVGHSYPYAELLDVLHAPCHNTRGTSTACFVPA